MGPTGRLVTIKRSGGDGHHFPLSLSTCLFGRGIECDIRIQLPVVSKQHCKIEINEQKAVLFNFSSTNPTQVNGSAIDGPVQLKHGDVITVIDRSFRHLHGGSPGLASLPTLVSSFLFCSRFCKVPTEKKVRGRSHGTPEQLGTPAGSPGLSSVDVSNLGDSTNKTEGMPLKRRRVSFGGHLRPELFDENLPPNTPLKRGETPMKRRSLVTHSPAVLKKIIKEQSQPSGKEEASEIRFEVTTQNTFRGSPVHNFAKTTPAANDGRRRSSKPSAPSGRESPQQTDVPKRGGRRSSGVPSKRASVDRSQHEILQMIHSRRRSGASEANLIVAKSWADVVKLCAKQTQTKVVRHGPPRQPSKRQRRMSAPKKPPGSVHSEFSTGHANSPCTIVIGKAHIEKVNMPARPYRMLNNFMFNKKIDFNEDLSGLTEMFKTPGKEKPRKMSICLTTFANSEDLLGKQFQVSNSEEKPLLHTPEHFGENVFPGAQNVQEESWDKKSSSPAFTQQCITVNENTRTPRSEKQPLKAASGANKSRRSAELRTIQMMGAESEKEDKEVDTAQNILGRCLRKSAVQAQLLEGEMEGSERSFETCKKNIEPKENSEKLIAVRRSRRSSEPKCVPRPDVVTIKRSQEIESKEDLVGMHSSLRTPCHGEEPVNTENKTTMMYCKSPDPFSTPTKMSTRIKTPSQSVTIEDLSALRKPTQTPGDMTPMHKEPVGGDKSMKALKEAPELKLDLSENVTGCRRRSRTPKRKVKSMEDLAGFKELFQTPDHILEPVTDDKTTRIPCKSPQAEPVNTPTSTKRRFRTPLGKVEVEEQLSALRKPSPGETTRSRSEPEGDDKRIKPFKETPKQKLDSAENETGSRRRSRTPKRKVQPMEDLVAFKELFRTPIHIVKPVTDDNAIISCKSSQAEPVSTPTSTKRSFRTPLRKVEVEEQLSALRKLTATPVETTNSHREPEGDDKSTGFFKETPEQKLNSAENVTGSRKRSRTPKRKVQPMEDLAGIKELFQTPDHILEPVTDDRTTRIPCKSPQAEPVSTPTSTKRRFRTPLGKVEVEEQLSALSKPTPGETAHSRSEPEGDDKRIKPFKETPKQKLDSAENETGSGRRSRTPKRKAQPMEDLVAFKELLRTPIHFMETVTDDNTEISCESPQAEPVSTPTSTKRSFRTPLWKVEVEEQLSALRKLTATLGETTQSHREPEDDDKSIKPFKETPKQKLYSAENIIGSRRRSRTPKRKVQPMEDLAGIKELFQTPDHIVETVTDDRTTRIVCQSPQPEPAITFTSVTRQLKTPLGKMDVEKQLSPLTKLTATPGDNTHSHREPFKETPEEQLDSAVYVTGSRRRSKTPKRKVQPMEDLAGIKELFQTPDHIVQPVTDDRSTRMPCKSPKAEPVSTPTSTKRSFRTPLGKVEVEEQLSALRKPPPRETTQSCREPEGDDKNTGFFKETPKQKLDSAENIIGSRRRSRTPKRKVQPMEDLVGIKELFQTPDHIVETVTDDRTTRIVCQSPQPEPAITFTSITRQLKTPLGKMDVEKQLSPLSKLTATPGDNTHSHREPFKETPEEQLDSAVYVTGSRRRSKTPKRKVQPMEDLAGIKELFQTPDHIVQPVTDDKSTRMPCKSPKAEPVSTPTSTKRRFRTPLGKVEVEEQLSALRKPPPRETTQSCREPEGDDKNTGFFKETPKQKLDSAENETGSRRRSRTPKRKAQPMEDLDGFKELFQTPTMEPVTDDKTKIPCKSPHAEPFVMPTGRNKEGLSASRRPTRTLRKTTQSHREPEMADKVILSKETLDSAENVTRSKRRLRTCKEKPLEDPAHLKELFQIPGHTDGPVTGVKTTEMPSKSPQPESIIVPVRMRRQLRAPPAKVDVEEGLSAPRRPTRTLGKTTRSHRGPEMADKDVKVFKESLGQKLDPAENVTGSKRPRTRREKSQPLEDPAHLKELFQIPGHTDEPVTGVKTTETPSESSQPELVIEPVCTRRQLRAPPAKVDMEEGLPAPRRPTRTLGKPTPSHRGPEMADKDVKVFKESLGQKLDAAENVTGSKRPRTRKEKSQPLEDPAHLKELFQIPGHTDEMPSESSQPELVIEPVRMRRQLRAPPAKVDMEEGLPAPRRPTRTLGKPTPSHRGPEMADKDLKVFKESPRQKLGPVENAMVSTRQLRSRKGKAQPLEGPAHCRQLLPSPVQDKELDTGAESIPRTSLQAPDQSKPAKPRRVLRALNGKPGEDLVGSREPVKSQRESSISQPPERSREDGSPPGMRSRRTRTCAQGTAEEKPLQKRQGTDRSEPPGPLKKRQRVWAESTEPVADVPSKDVQTKNMVRDVEDVTFSNKGMSLRSRLPNKTDRAEQRPEILVSAEKVKIKRNEKKPMNASQEVKIQNPEDGATNSVPGDKVHERRRCLRPGRRGKVPLPSGAEEKARERMETQVKTQEEKEGAQRSGSLRLRSRKVMVRPTGDTVQSQPEQRVTRRAKRPAEKSKQENEDACVKKIRTRSRRGCEDI
ncbi:proliferation marker protein Ki-67 isoform X3 [Molossus molossus]|uniref:proliferation marker protein Ki-67 isoform X3 n=1 Tax=Molossus molossus TaxID=27622 RepID=UPI0017476549|nr:proliferation marker protein Ki-67 isoform X3 [Molossus molossus]